MRNTPITLEPEELMGFQNDLAAARRERDALRSAALAVLDAIDAGGDLEAAVATLRRAARDGWRRVSDMRPPRGAEVEVKAAPYTAAAPARVAWHPDDGLVWRFENCVCRRVRGADLWRVRRVAFTVRPVEPLADAPKTRQTDIPSEGEDDDEDELPF